MKAKIILEINNKKIELTLLEALELREQLNELTGIGEVNKEKKNKDMTSADCWNINNGILGPLTNSTTPITFTYTDSGNYKDNTDYSKFKVYCDSMIDTENVSDIIMKNTTS